MFVCRVCLVALKVPCRILTFLSCHRQVLCQHHHFWLLSFGYRQYCPHLSVPGAHFSGGLHIAGEFFNLELQEQAHLMSEEEEDRGLGYAFQRDDQRLQQRRERDDREKDTDVISESHFECYPRHTHNNRDIVDNDEDEDLTKMDMVAGLDSLPFLLL